MKPAGLAAVILCAGSLLAQEEGIPEPGLRETAGIPTPVDRGDTAASRVVFPLAYYSPETGLAGMLAAGLYRRFPNRERPSSMEGQGVYTQKNQYILALHGEHYLPGRRGFVSVGASFLEFPDLFYGIGRMASDEEGEKYSAHSVNFDVDAHRPIWSHLRAGGIFEWHRHVVSRKETGGLLDQGGIKGSGTTLAWGIGPQILWDSRDNTFYPTTGAYGKASMTYYPRWLGGTYAFGGWQMEGRRYLPLGKRMVFALRGKAQEMRGDIPFPIMPTLGGDLLRGYYQGRYRDRHLACAEAEWRYKIWRAVGATVFSGLGSVGASWQDLSDAPLRYAYGVGLRIRLNPQGMNLRVDQAFPRTGDAATYIQFSEAF